MLTDKKILVTGPAGQIAFPLCEALAADNEVWGVARFGDPATRDRVEAIGVTAVTGDLAEGRFDDLPDDFDYVLHLATFMGPGEDYDHALTVNAEGTGLLLQHCRKAKAALVMSTAGVYRPADSAEHLYVETDPLGDAVSAHARTYAMSKNAEEAVARACARMFDLPVTIARMNSAYGPNGGLPAYHLDWMIAGQPIVVRADPNTYSPIHESDIAAHVGPLLDAASAPATIVNWGGDEVVTAQEWCAYLGELAGVTPDVQVQPLEGSAVGIALDPTKRISITGPCTVSWRDGFRDMYEKRYADGTDGGVPDGPSARLLGAVKADD